VLEVHVVRKIKTAHARQDDVNNRQADLAGRPATRCILRK
jgi:hypothetical protein